MRRPALPLPLSLALALIHSVVPRAQAEEQPAGRVLIRAGHLLDIHTGKEAADQTVIVTGGLITGIAATGATPKQATDREIDLSALTVLPGLIDVHTHLTMDTNFDPYHELSTSVAKSALIGARDAKVTLEAGFTTVRNVGAAGYADVDLRDAIEEELVPGPHMQVSGPALGITGGHCDDNLLPEKFHEQGEGVADGAQGILWATQAGVDSIEHGSYMNDEDIAAMKAHGTYFVPTAYLIDWMAQSGKLPPLYLQKMKDVSAVEKANAKKAIAAHVKIALGTDAAVYPHGLNAHELEVYVEQFGMAPLAALQTGTLNAADLMGWSDKVGSIDAGKWADLIAVKGDPLLDVKTLQHVAFVMKSGKVYKNEAP